MAGDLAMMPAADSEGSWERQTVALRAGLGPQLAPGGCVIWSPVLRKRVRVDAAEWAFLASFEGGVRVGEHMAKLASLAGGEASDHWHLSAYLRTRKYLALGFLVEETVLAASEIAGLYFCPEIVAGELDADRRSRAVTTILQNGSPLSPDAVDRGKYQALAAALHDRAKRREIAGSPLQVCRTRTGRLVLAGNVELACVAVQAGISLRVQLLQAADWLSMAVDMPDEFFGTMRGDMPYQSLFLHGEEIIPGRRRDLNERLDKLDPDDLRDKAVLDLGCNIGMNCFLASERGARAATGIDLPAFAHTATRLNAVYEAPCRFLARDLSREVTGLGHHDTVLAFAIIGHVGSAEGLLRTIGNVNAKTVYIESHCDIQEQGELNALLSAGLFRSVEFRGYGLDNVARNERTRRLYRCVTRHGS